MSISLKIVHNLKYQRAYSFRVLSCVVIETNKHSMEDIEINVKPKFKGGGSFIDLPPTFSDNGLYCYVAWKNLIYSYNIKTGKRILEYKGYDETIIGFDLYCLNGAEYLCACSSDGNIITWNVDTALKVKKTNIGTKLMKSFKIIEMDHNFEKTVVAIVSWQVENMLKFGSLNLQNFAFTEYKIKLAVKKVFFMDIGGSGENLYFSLVQRKKMYYAKFNQQGTIIKKSIGGDRKFTCIACHPEEECVLTGDSTGRVLLWQGLSLEYASQAVFHWHSLPVNSVAFSTSGSQFYSGGAERVLVKWNIDSPSQRNFLPRLPSDIKQISIAKDNLFIAISTADNGIQIVDARFNLVSTIQHLVLGNNFSSGIIFDPRTKSLVMNGCVGHLQFYSPDDMHLLYNLDVGDLNVLTGERDVVILNTEITKVAINRTGLWMATVEEYGKSDNICYETRIKFWNFDTSKQTFELNTSIEYPHNDTIIDIQFQPTMKDTDIRCVTISNDKHFKIWQLIKVTTVYSSNFTWRCACDASYRGLNPEALAFSYDGSLMAIPFSNMVTTWLPDSCELKCSLAHPSYADCITKVAFGVRNLCHLVVTASNKQLSVWNLLTLTLVWTVPVKITHLVADLMTSHIAAFTSNKIWYVFEPSSPNPVFIHKDLTDTNILVKAAAFIPNPYTADSNKEWYQRSQLVYVDSNNELYCFDANEEVLEPTHLRNEEINNSLFNAVIAAKKSGTLTQYRPSNVTHNRVAHEKILQEFLDIPCHTMPPMALLCEKFLMSLSLREKDSKINTIDDDMKVKYNKFDDNFYNKIEKLYGKERLKNVLL